MYTAPTTHAGGSFALPNLFRRIRQYPERRFQRDLQQRAEWIYQARHAPTVQEWFDYGSR